MVELDELVEQIISWAGNLAAGTARWFELIARFDRLEGFARWECVSTAQWLNWQCGLDLRAAREHVRVARCLEDLPLIRERFCRGELSYSKVRAITRVATPASEADLVMLATHGTAAHVERIVAALRRLSGPADPDQVEQIYQRRALHWYHHEDGSFELRVRVPPEDGVVLRAAIQQALTAQPEPRRLHAQCAADALVEIASRYLDGVAERGTRPRCDVSVHVEATVLAADSEPEGDSESGAIGRCHLEDGPPIAAETARRLTCDAIVIDPPVAKGDAADVTVGVGTRVRRTRTIPQALRRQMPPANAAHVA